MVDYYCRLDPDRFYHIYNRGNNGDALFFRKENYEYFLRKYDEYLSLHVETYCFCLLRNHFHLLVRIKTADEIKLSATDVTERMGAHERLIEPQTLVFKHLMEIPEQVVELFRRFFTSYSKSIAVQKNHTGSLFQRKFKRKLISDANYFQNVVYYIHANPQLHGIIDNFKLYPWSSYNRILVDRPSRLSKAEVIRWFEDKENYAGYHWVGRQVEDRDFVIEDDDIRL